MPDARRNRPLASAPKRLRPAPPSRPALPAPAAPDALTAALVAALRPMIRDVVRDVMIEFVGAATSKPSPLPGALDGAPPFLSFAEYGKRVGVQPRTVRSHVSRGLIRTVRIVGSKPRIPRSELERVVRESFDE